MAAVIGGLRIFRHLVDRQISGLIFAADSRCILRQEGAAKIFNVDGVADFYCDPYAIIYYACHKLGLSCVICGGWESGSAGTAPNLFYSGDDKIFCALDTMKVPQLCRDCDSSLAWVRRSCLDIGDENVFSLWIARRIIKISKKMERIDAYKNKMDRSMQGEDKTRPPVCGYGDAKR